MYLHSNVKLLMPSTIVTHLVQSYIFYLASVVPIVESFTPLLLLRNKYSSQSHPFVHQKYDYYSRQIFDFSTTSKSSNIILHSHRRPLEDARKEIQLEHEAECQRSESLFFYYKDKPYDQKNETVNEYITVQHKLEWESFSFPFSIDIEEKTCTHDNQKLIIDCKPPHPFTQQDLAKVSTVPLFTKKECANIIQEAENLGKWRTAHAQASYAKNASTFYQIRQDTLPQTKQWLDQKLQDVIYPAVTCAFSHIPSLSNVKYLRCSAASVVKYNATAGQTSLGLHRDAPLLALTIPLNDLNEYDGGGTFIEALSFQSNSTMNVHHSEYHVMDNVREVGNTHGYHDHGIIKRDTGHLIMHPAMLRHAGKTITRGLRYILVAWIFSSGFIALEHYSLIRANRYLAQALRIHPSSGSQYRLDLLNAAVSGYEEALEFGSANVTESALIGLGQAMLELRSFSSCRLNEEGILLMDGREVAMNDYENNIRMTQEALNLFTLAKNRTPSNNLAWEMKRKAIKMLKDDCALDPS